MPALVKSRVGSWAGTSGEDRTTVCPRRRKYSRNRARMSLPVIGAVLYAAVFLDAGEVGPPLGEQDTHRVAHRRGRIAAAQEVVGQAGGRPGGLAAQQGGQPAAPGFERARGLPHFLERGRDRGFGHRPGNSLGEELLVQPVAPDPAPAGTRLGPPASEGLVVHVATLGEVGHDGLGDLGGSATAPEAAGQLAAAPGLAGQKIEGRQSGGLRVQRRGGPRQCYPAFLPKGLRAAAAGAAVLLPPGCSQVISPVEKMPLILRSKSSGFVAASRAVSYVTSSSR